MAVAVILDGKVAETVCAGERSFGSGVSVTLDDLWAFGSIGKSMTALLAARLIEKGQLSWSTTIQDIYPELKTSIRPEYCSVTIEDLMLHIGGTPIDDIVVRQEIKEIFLSGLPLQQARRAFVEASLACEPVAPVGQESIYSNSGITVAGAMMEEITGKPWEQIVREEVLDPLGLDTMGFGVPRDTLVSFLNHEGTSPVKMDNRSRSNPQATIHPLCLWLANGQTLMKFPQTFQV